MVSFKNPFSRGGGGPERGSAAPGEAAAGFTAKPDRRDGLRPLAADADRNKGTVDFYVSQSRIPGADLRAALKQQFKGPDGEPDINTVEQVVSRIETGWDAKGK